MSGPFIFIATNRLKEGKFEEEQRRVPGLCDFIEANEPRLRRVSRCTASPATPCWRCCADRPGRVFRWWSSGTILEGSRARARAKGDGRGAGGYNKSLNVALTSRVRRRKKPCRGP